MLKKWKHYFLTHEDRIESVLKGCAFAIAGLALVYLAIMLPGEKSRKEQEAKLQREMEDKRIVSLIEPFIAVSAKQVSSLSGQVHRVNQVVTTISNVTTEAKLMAKFQEIASKVPEVEERMGRLERAILQDPAKALEMPLLRKDFDHLKIDIETEARSLRNEVSLLRDQIKIFSGVIAFPCLLMALTLFFKKQDSGARNSAQG